MDLVGWNLANLRRGMLANIEICAIGFEGNPEVRLRRLRRPREISS